MQPRPLLKPILQFLALASLLTLAAGCATTAAYPPGTQLTARIRVFELAPQKLPTFIDTSWPSAPPDSSYRVALLPPELAEPMVHAACSDVGLLLDQTERCSWSQSGSTWAYSIATSPKLQGGGNAAGFLTGSATPTACQFGMHFRVFHGIGDVYPIESQIDYSSPVYLRQSLVFFAPVIRESGERSLHVIMFTFSVFEPPQPNTLKQPAPSTG